MPEHENYKPLRSDTNAYANIFEKLNELQHAVASLGRSRELSLARTRIEEAGMWIIQHKAVSNDGRD